MGAVMGELKELYIILLVMLLVGIGLFYLIPSESRTAVNPYNPQPGDSLVCYVVTWISLEDCNGIFKTVEWVNPSNMDTTKLDLLFKPDTIWAENGMMLGIFKAFQWKKKIWRKY